MNNKIKECPDCKQPVGTLHDFGCCVERCPLCRNQLITCGCIPDNPTNKTSINDNNRFHVYDTVEQNFKPPDVGV